MRKDSVFSINYKKNITVILLVILFLPLQKIHSTNNVLKAKVLGGYVLPVGLYSGMSRSVAYGVELDYEMLSLGKENWGHHWGFPTVGFSLSGINLGNYDELGQMIAFYPYLNWRVVNTDQFVLGLRIGVGFAGFTKLNPINGAYISGIVGTGISLEFPIKDSENIYRYAVLVDVGTKHTNNGNIMEPNATMNMVYGSVGFKNRFGDNYRKNIKAYRHDLPYDMMVNITAAGGARYFDFKKDTQKDFVPIANLHVDAVWRLTNCYALGFGVDAFYNGMFMKQGYSDGANYNEYTNYRKYFIDNENFSNKIRVGVSLANAFTIGRVTLLLDGGVYLFDPIKDAYSSTVIDRTKNRSIFYSFNAQKEDGWCYFRGGLRYTVVDNLYLSVAVKTHLYSIDCVEWGIGYSIPIKKSNFHRNKYGEFKKYQILGPSDYGRKY